MSRMIPPQPRAGTPASEKRVFEALRRLPNEWTVLHSVAWQSKRRGRQGDGEADFVLVGGRHGVLVVEVKGGNVAIRQGCWISTDHSGVEHLIKDPFKQATDSKHALLSYLSDNGVRLADISLMHAVAFPDIVVKSSLGPAAPTAITWDSRALAGINDAVGATVRHWGGNCSLSIKEVEHLIKLIAPTVSIRRRLAEEVADVRTDLIRLTDEQVWAFGQLRSVRSALVLGQAFFTIVAAVAQLERDLIRERVAAGIRVARQNGKRLGRPRVIVSTDEILRLRAEGQSSRRIAAALGIGEGTVRDRLNSQARKTSVVSGS